MSDPNEGLENLEPDGQPPESRMEDPIETSYRIQQLMDGEKHGRSARRALVKGLVDGNPPYRQSDIRKAGRRSQCNVNWRVSEYYLNQARSAFYDVFSESPGYATVRTDFGNTDEIETFSRIITEEFDRLLRDEPSWDYANQISQYEMILYGCGPLIFCDGIDYRNEAVLNQNLLVPEMTLSDTHRWEEAAVVRDYLSHELYDKIRRESIASEMGWNVEATKKAIMKACIKTNEGGQYSSWTWHQQMLKNKSYWYSSQSKVIQAVHYYFREFPLPGQQEGRITHCILINPEAENQEQSQFLFRSVGRFKSWDDIIHPMYYDNDGGGYHHSVTGLGVKMYSAMEYQNRLLCNLADKTFAPKILFKPTTANANEQLDIIQFGDYGKVPAQFDTVQIPIGSYIDDGLAFHREMTRLVASNLSQYSPALSKESGNPITAYEASVRASEQARLGKTQLNHYYNQIDGLYLRKFTRAANPRLNSFDPGGASAHEFQKRCRDRGVPPQALLRIESVKATRIVGQGSQFMRQQSLEKLMATLSLWPSEGGRNNLLSDYIASLTGQAMVNRYNPPIETSSAVSDQKAFATLQVGAAKDGVAPVVSGSQNHFVFASVFLKAAGDAVGSLEKGGDPAAVYQFIETIGPAIAQHLGAVSGDPTRADIVKAMADQWKKLAAFHDQLGQQLQQQQQKQQQAMQKTQAIQQGTDPEQQLAQAEFEAEQQRKNAKLQADMGRKDQTTAQKLRINDLTTASKIINQSRTAEASSEK